jgi:hypothetical protein
VAAAHLQHLIQFGADRVPHTRSANHLPLAIPAKHAIAPSGALWYLGGEKIVCISEHKSDSPNILRRGHDQPAATSVHGWRYHHIGIPTDVPRPGEYYLEQFKMYVSAFETSPCGIQWMRFEPDSPVHALIKSVPHIAFEVDDLQAAIEGKEILTAPNSPSEGVTVAMILDSGAPVELLEFRRDLSSAPTR